MGLLSLFMKNKQKQETTDDSDSGEFHSHAEEESKSARGNGKRAASVRKAKTVDPVLPEKKRARRRLIGAVALVLAAVIGLPMLFDSEPKPLADDINIQIPSKEKTFSADMPNAGETSAKAMVAPVIEKNKARTSEPIEEVIAPEATTPADVVPKKESPLPTKAELKAAPISVLPEPKAENKTGSKVEAKPSVQVNAHIEPTAKLPGKPETATETARAMAILEAKGPAKKTPAAEVATKSATSFVVQVAALATQGKANELQAKLKTASIKSYTQKIATTSGDIIRIRVGPFDSKEEAEKTRAKLVKLGLSGTVIPN
jgi:DedD protein